MSQDDPPHPPRTRLRIIPRLRPGTLFARTGATIAVVSLTFFVFTFVLLAGFIILPLAQRTADNLASLMVLTASSWEGFSPNQRHLYEEMLGGEYGLTINRAPPGGLIPRAHHVPFFLLVEGALADRLGRSITIEQAQGDTEPTDFWVEIPSAHAPITVGFHYSHHGLEPPLILLLILGMGILATLATSVVLARRLTRPLERLSRATRSVGSGSPIQPLPETGPLELAELARHFNAMSGQVQDLLANRTTLLAGVSHDLRTPLTRLELALEMLDPAAEPELAAGMRRDLEQMNRLIGLFLEIAKGLQEEQRQRADIEPLLSEVVADFRRNDVAVEWTPGPPCYRTIHPLALRRIINNLMENAVRYGEGKPIELRYYFADAELRIEVLDRGPGIPEDQREAVFRPFHRLEQSRSLSTGGSGLGLSIVRQLAEANGCKVEVLSREGGGACVRIRVLGK